MKNNKNRVSILMALCILTFFALFSEVSASDNKLVLGSDFTLEEGQRLHGDLAIFGGDVTLKKGSKVDGDVAMFGGRLKADGEIDGDVAAFGGKIEFGNDAYVDGDLFTFGASIERAKGAIITGDTMKSEPFQKKGDIIFAEKNQKMKQNPFDFIIGFFTGFILFIIKTAIIVALAMLAVLFFEKDVKDCGAKGLAYPLQSLGIGLMIVILTPIAMIIMFISVILIPVAMILLILFAVLCLYAWIIAGYELGKKITSLMKVNLQPVLIAAAGTFILTFTLNGIEKIIPCVGWIPSFGALIFGMGAIAIKHGRFFEDDSRNDLKYIRSASVKESADRNGETQERDVHQPENSAPNVIILPPPASPPDDTDK